MMRRMVVFGGAAALSLSVLRAAQAEGAGSGAATDLVVVRTFPTTPEKLWAAWAEPDLVAQWWGPLGWTCPLARMDLRAGGVSLVAMQGPGMPPMYSTWTYETVSPYSGFTYRFNLSDDTGTAIDPASLGMPPDFPQNALHILAFRPVDGGTEMTMTETGYTNQGLKDMSRMGLEQCLDKMAALFS